MLTENSYITFRIYLDKTPDVWKAKYYYDGVWISDKTERIYNELVKAVKETKTTSALANAIESILGSDNWINRFRCTMCNRHSSKFIVFEGKNDTFYYVCNICLTKAQTILKKVKA